MNKGIVVFLMGVAIVVAGTWYLLSAQHTESQANNSSQTKETANKEDSVSQRQAGNDSGSQNTGGAPKLFFPETSYDFGSVAQQTKVSHTFVVRNIGEAALKLISAKAG